MQEEVTGKSIVAGRITDEKFSMMSKTYEDEQA